MLQRRHEFLLGALKAARTRRAVLRAAAGVMTGLVAAGDRQQSARAADPAPPLPPPSFDPWPVCSEERPHYCVAALSVDGVDQLAANEPGYFPLVMGTGSSADATVASRLEWSVWSQGPHDPLTILDVENDVTLRVRAGKLYPLVTFAQAAQLRMTITGDAASGWDVEMRGLPGLMAYRDEPDGEHAAWEQARFSGTGFDAAGSEAKLWDGFEGYIATTATEFTPPRWSGDGWSILLGAPHWRLDDSINIGSYAAWITAESLQRLELTPREAAAGSLIISRADDGVAAAVDARVSELDGGILVEIPILTFSSPTISIRRRRRIDDGVKRKKRCRKGRAYDRKKKRCIKKRHKKH